MFSPYAKTYQPRSDDAKDLRLAHWVHNPQFHSLGDILPEIRPEDFVILGYPDDRGVDRNGGRLGASDGPNAIRKILYKMTPHPSFTEAHFRIWDLGNLNCWSMGLTEAHTAAQKALKSLRETRASLITLGGGHDWAFPDFIEFKGHLLNLDAHLDMRPLEKSSDVHSGAAFRKILAQNTELLSLGVLGLQRHCNARHHIEYAQGQRTPLLFVEDLPASLEAQWDLIRDTFNLKTSAPGLYGLSLDLDVFSQSVAPGVSAPQPEGLNPWIVRRLIHEMAPRTPQFGIYEMNPRYDLDEATARLAARMIHEYLFTRHGSQK